MKNSIIKEKSFSLSLRVVKLYQYLTENKQEHIMSKIIKSRNLGWSKYKRSNKSRKR